MPFTNRYHIFLDVEGESELDEIKSETWLPLESFFETVWKTKLF